MRDVFVFAGQSNMSAYSPLSTLTGSRAATNPGHAYNPPDDVDDSDKTALNEWTGASPASPDSGAQYAYPTDANAACLYNENVSGLADRFYDSWGTHVKSFGQYNLGGTVADGGTYGPELSFLYRHLSAYPSTPIGAVKQALGGSSLRSDWLPNSVTLGTAQAGSATTITLAAGNFFVPTGLYVRVTGGTGSGSVGLCTAYNAGTQVATLAGGWSGTAPSAGSTYGIEQAQFQILRTMLTQAAARLDASDGSGNWRWAAFVWMQGESGSQSPATAADDSQYLSDSRGLYAAVRGLTRADLPVVIGRIGNNWGWSYTGDSSDTTHANTYLKAAGYPYACLEASYQSSQGVGSPDGRISTIPTLTRDGYLAGAAARRATQLTLAGDANCTWYDNDDLPVRPPYDLTAAENDLYAYHHGGPGNLAAGERAFAAYQSLAGRRVRPSNVRGLRKLRVA